MQPIKASSTEVSKSTTLLPDVILREQSNKEETLGLIARSLEKISMLWQIPNWTPGNSVLLAEWIFDNYGFEPLELILNCLAKPPIDQDKIYRLTPDVVSKWMSQALERQADQLESQHRSLKEGEKNQIQADINNEEDYIKFYKENFFKFRESYDPSIRDTPKHWADDEKYKAFKAERMRHQELNKEKYGKQD